MLLNACKLRKADLRQTPLSVRETAEPQTPTFCKKQTSDTHFLWARWDSPQTPIYTRGPSKRGRCRFCVAGSRTSPSPWLRSFADLRPVRGRGGHATRSTSLSPRPRERVFLPHCRQCSSVSRRDVIRSTIYSGSTGLPDVATKPVSKGRHHSRSRKSATGPLSGCLSGSSTWSSRPPAFARLVARSLNGCGSAPFLLQVIRDPAELRGQDPVRCHRFEHRVKDAQQLPRDGHDGSLPPPACRFAS